MAEIARSELILGGQKSGKSRRAERMAHDWLQAEAGHRALLLATARPWDEDMRQRIARHQADRAAQAPGLATLEVGADLASALWQHSRPDTLLVVDCLTLWLTQLLMPVQGDPQTAAPLVDDLCAALDGLPGPVVLVGNEIGLGVIPLGREVRAFVDELGLLNQRVAAVCHRVTLMVAGCPLTVKGGA